MEPPVRAQFLKKDGTVNEPWKEYFMRLFGGGGGSSSSGGTNTVNNKAMPNGEILGDTDVQNVRNKTLYAPRFANLTDGMPLELSGAVLTNVYGHKITEVNHSSNTVLTLSDLRKVHVFDCSLLDIECTLPSVDDSNIGDWIILAKSGDLSLRVYAPDFDTIMDSAQGGSLLCEDSTYAMEKIGLILLTGSAWHVGPDSFGIWKAL